MTHWANDYIGDPWIAGEHDCWAFVRRVWREQFHIEVPPVDVDACSRMACARAFDHHDEKANWSQILKPNEGDAALIGKSARASHVGMYVDANGGAILHCVQGFGVVCQDVPSLKAAGWHVLGYYRRVAP
jgi:cell wall-associated NlpC family hydrolase